MKKLNQFLLLITCLFVLINSSNAKGIKFGKISKEEFALKECSYEKEASAVILSRTCTVNLYHSMITYNHHVRIKILKEEGIDQANIALSYYKNNRIDEITNIKGYTISLNDMGKQELVKLDKKSIFDIDVDEHYGEVRITMPDVKVGSIIEFKYEKNSQFYSFLDTWYFQDEIPTLYSSIKVNMSESFRYNMVMFGSKVQEKYPQLGGKEWVLTDMPSIKEEAYVNNYHDFVEQLRFQLAGYYTRDKTSVGGALTFKKTMTSYEELAKEYSERVYFLGRSNFAKKQLESILDGSENQWGKLEKIYDFVRTNLKWNEKYRIYPKKSPPNLLKDGVGSNSEINYLLVLLLREAGFDCNPALSRSNNRGLIQKTYPLLSQFDQVLACVELDGKQHFLNACSPYRPYNLVAEEDLNYHAFVLRKENPYWAKIAPNKTNYQYIAISYNYTDVHKPTSSIILRESGYMAAESRKRLSEIKPELWMSELLDVERFDFQVDSVRFKNEKNVNLPFRMKCDLNLENGLNPENDIHYIDLFNEQDLKNPFLKESRQYRIDYNYPRSKTYMVKFILPEGYQFEDYPKAKKIVLDQQAGEFTLRSKLLGNELSIQTSFSINMVSFTKEYYDTLRGFYSQMIKAMGSQVVIKKTNNSSKK